MPEQNGEKTQDATPHRRQKAHEEGSVARSQDLGSAVLLIVAIGGLMFSGEAVVRFLVQYARHQIGGDPWLETDLAASTVHLAGLFSALSEVLVPFFGLLLASAILVNLGQVGFLFLPSKVGFDLTRLDPLAGMGRIISVSNAVRLVLGIFKIGVILVVRGTLRLWRSAGHTRPPRQDCAGDRRVPGPRAALDGAEDRDRAVVLALLDYGYQWWRHEQDLKMTPQEVREEMRNLEGDPQIIARRRAVQRQLLAHRLAEAVPKADVVVTNPTELAVALQYEPKTMAAPIVVAKGAGVMAQRIRQLALEHGIPIVEKKPLAQALYREVDVNQPVPHDKYAAVAELLAYVYQLKGKRIAA